MVPESSFSTLESEMAPGVSLALAADEAGPELHEFIEGDYNARRLHPRNEYRSTN